MRHRGRRRSVVTDAEERTLVPVAVARPLGVATAGTSIVEAGHGPGGGSRGLSLVEGDREHLASPLGDGGPDPARTTNPGRVGDARGRQTGLVADARCPDPDHVNGCPGPTIDLGATGPARIVGGPGHMARATSNLGPDLIVEVEGPEDEAHQVRRLLLHRPHHPRKDLPAIRTRPLGCSTTASGGLRSGGLLRRVRKSSVQLHHTIQ